MKTVLLLTARYLSEHLLLGGCPLGRCHQPHLQPGLAGLGPGPHQILPVEKPTPAQTQVNTMGILQYPLPAHPLLPSVCAVTGLLAKARGKMKKIARREVSFVEMTWQSEAWPVTSSVTHLDMLLNKLPTWIVQEAQEPRLAGATSSELLRSAETKHVGVRRYPMGSVITGLPTGLPGTYYNLWCCGASLGTRQTRQPAAEFLNTNTGLLALFCLREHGSQGYEVGSSFSLCPHLTLGSKSTG